MNNNIFKVQEGFSTGSYSEVVYSNRILPANSSVSVHIIDRSGIIYASDAKDYLSTKISKITPGSTPGSTPVITQYMSRTGNLINAMAFDSSQNLYIFQNGCVYKITGGGSTITTYAGMDGQDGYINGNALNSVFNRVFSMVFDSANNLYLADIRNHCIRKITTDGQVSTYAGPLPGVTPAKGTADGNSTSARFDTPRRITIDSSGNLYVIDHANKIIRKISTSRVVTTISSGYSNPTEITIDSRRNLYVLDLEAKRINKLIYNNTTNTYTKTDLFNNLVFSSSHILIDSLGILYLTFAGKIVKILQSCPAGSYANNGVCELCPIGTWSSSNAAACTACATGRTTPFTGSTSSSNCTMVSQGYYMSNTTVLQCPSNSSCPSGIAGSNTPTFTCSDGYEKRGAICQPCPIGSYGSNGSCIPCSNVPETDTTSKWTTIATAQTSCLAVECKPNHNLNALSNRCEPCPSNTGGLNCTSAFSGFYMRGGNALPCPSNANCVGELSSFDCSNGYMKNISGDNCDECPLGSSGTDCKQALPDYYMTSAGPVYCPSNASCTGGSDTFICSNGYMLNQMENGCLQCQQGFGGPNCTEAFPGYYLHDNRPVACPSNAICEGGIGSYTCSNGYFVNNRTGTCDVVTTIIQPGDSQLRNTIGPPTIADTTRCTPTGCVLLFKDPGSGRMLPVNPCIRQGNSYDFRTKKCVSKCCFMLMSNARTNSDCKTYVINTKATKNTSLCRSNPRNPCCTATAIPTNVDCKRFWTPGVSTWSPEYNRLCADGFTDYNKLETMLEKRQKWYESRKILNSS